MTNKNIIETPIDEEGISWVERNFEFPNRTIRLATTFSGIGAIEYAITKRLNLNCEILFAGDINENCRKSYMANYGFVDNDPRWHTDIYDFHADKYKGKVDLLVGGAPCQAFSTVGKQLGFDDTRGTLFREYARVIKECEPKVFIFENVQGMYRHDNGKTWQIISNTFKDYCGYKIFYRRLNSKNYGIPQHRERLFCIGFKDDSIDFLFPKPISPCPYRMQDFLLDDKSGPLYDIFFNSNVITPNATPQHIADLLQGYADLKFNEFIFECVPPGEDVERKHYLSKKVADYVLAGGTKTFKTSKETDLQIARPLLQSMHKMHRAGVDNYVHSNPNIGEQGLRRLTPRECLRLMGYRDDFVYEGVVSDTATYMQAGNSIVVDVLIALLKQMDITKFAEPNNEE